MSNSKPTTKPSASIKPGPEPKPGLEVKPVKDLEPDDQQSANVGGGGAGAGGSGGKIFSDAALKSQITPLGDALARLRKLQF